MAAKKAGMATGVEVARISVKVSPDTKQFRAKLKQELEEIERTVKGDVHVKAHLDSAQARADFQRMKQQMERGGRIRVGVDLDPAGSKKASNDARNTILGVFGKGGGIGFPKGLLPSFGSGINPAGYAAIIAGLALIAAPLVGLVSTLVLAIPGMISAIATPMMAIGLGLEGIKKAASNSGLFSLDDKGEIDGLGPVFDKVKANVSQAFEEGLTPALKQVAAAIDPLLGSLPKVATGLSEMFQGFVDSLTSAEGMRLFDDTIKNIGEAMTQAAPGVRSFTDGMLGIANSFTQSLPGLSNWFNRTGDSFSKWVEEMTRPIEGPGIDGKSKMDLAFAGLGDTLKTIGDWAVDMGEAGLKFVSDPEKMKSFLGTLEDIGGVITRLVDLGNRLGPVLDVLDKILPEPASKLDEVGKDGKSGSESKVEEKPPGKPDKGFWDKVGDFFSGSALGSGGVQIPIGDKMFAADTPKNELSDAIRSEINSVNGRISQLETDIKNRVADSPYPEGEDPVLGNAKGRLRDLQETLTQLKEQGKALGLSPDVALASSESPLGGPIAQQLLAGLEDAPAKVQQAVDESKAAVAESGALTPEALGALSEEAAPKIPAPDTAAFSAEMQKLPAVTDEAMAAVTSSITAGGANAASAALIAATNIYNAMVANAALFQTVGLQMMAGLAAGIQAGSSMAIQAAVTAATSAYQAAKNALEIRSPSRKFMELGDYSMQGMAKGMENGVKPVIDQAKGLADKIADAFADGSVDPTTFLKGMSNKEINKVEKALGLESTRLQGQISALTYRNRGAKDPAVQAEIDRLKLLKQELSEQKQMIDLAQDYADIGKDSSGGEDPFVKAASGLMSMPGDFASATGKQFLSDLGIRGDGMIGNAITEGIKYVFNIGSVDEALSIKDREDTKSAMSAMGR